MSKLNKIFQSVPIKVPDRSGFDLSHESLFTTLPGTLTPCTVLEVLPGDTFSLGAMQKVTLPPFAVPFMGRIDACLEAFFVPNRLLWKGWESFITQNNGIQSVSNGGSSTLVPSSVPVIDVSVSSNRPFLGNSSLAHYLGLKQRGNASVGVYNALPFLAYHKICDDWYRDENNMKPFFPKVVAAITNAQSSFPNFAPFSYGNNALYSLAPANLSSTPYSSLVDTSIGLGSLRQRCWAKDYFTTATTRPQASAASSVTFDTSGSTGSFTISTLRAANSLQKWMERNNIAGTDYGSQILSHFGTLPPDAHMDKAVLLGQNRIPVYITGVENNASPENQSASTKNPYGNTLGSSAGFGSAFGKDSLIDNFTAKEHGFIMVMFSLVPHAYYDTGIDRMFTRFSYGDYPWPEFANIGDQPIYTLELCGDLPNSQGPISLQDIFGYNQRYAEMKHRLDRVSGLLEDGENLEVYALKRGFLGDAGSTGSDGLPELGKSFLTIPTDYLDQVSNVDSEVSEFGCIVDVFFDCRALRVLPEYSLPSL